MKKRDVICIIPARGGSKGIPRKNLKKFSGKPLMFYAVQSAKKSRYISDVYISTEDPDIKKTALSFKAKVIDRPKKLAGDFVTSEDVIIHALKEIALTKDLLKTDCLFVQATSPLSLPSDFDRLIECLWKGYDSAAFYSEDYGHFFGIDDMKKARIPRQKRQPKKREAGNAWAFSALRFLKNKKRLFGKIGLVKINEPRQLEIDSMLDFKIIEYIMKKKLSKGR